VPDVVVTAAAGLAVVVALAPNTPPPPDVVPVACVNCPVHVAPMGQQAIFPAASRVQVEPATQQAPPSSAARVVQES
jgi:hypothetical protein